MANSQRAHKHDGHRHRPDSLHVHFPVANRVTSPAAAPLSEYRCVNTRERRPAVPALANSPPLADGGGMTSPPRPAGTIADARLSFG